MTRINKRHMIQADERATTFEDGVQFFAAGTYELIPGALQRIEQEVCKNRISTSYFSIQHNVADLYVLPNKSGDWMAVAFLIPNTPVCDLEIICSHTKNGKRIFYRVLQHVHSRGYETMRMESTSTNLAYKYDEWCHEFFANKRHLKAYDVFFDNGNEDIKMTCGDVDGYGTRHALQKCHKCGRSNTLTDRNDNEYTCIECKAIFENNLFYFRYFDPTRCANQNLHLSLNFRKGPRSRFFVFDVEDAKDDVTTDDFLVPVPDWFEMRDEPGAAAASEPLPPKDKPGAAAAQPPPPLIEELDDDEPTPKRPRT